MTDLTNAFSVTQRSQHSDKVYRVMIADYDPLMRETLSSVISRIDGFSITHSIGNLQLVVDQFRRDTPDIVIIELDLPWMIGLDIAKEILAIDPETAIYTISTYDRFEIAQFAMEIKLAGHILKPVSPKTLMETFKHHKNVYKLKPSPQLALLSNIVRERTFDRFYYGLNNIAVSLQEEAGRNTVNLNNKLSNIHNSLSDFSHNNPLLSPFPLSEPTLLHIDKVVELCLFYIINSIFIVKSVKTHDRLKSVFTFLDNNITDSISLNHIVKKCFISQGHLSRIFKKCFNISVMDYIHMRKLVISKIYFLFTDHTISDVAEYIGYNERSYFSKIFKKFEKLTIQQYKQINHRTDIQAAIVSSNPQKFIHDVFNLTLV